MAGKDDSFAERRRQREKEAEKIKQENPEGSEEERTSSCSSKRRTGERWPATGERGQDRRQISPASMTDNHEPLSAPAGVGSAEIGGVPNAGYDPCTQNQQQACYGCCYMKYLKCLGGCFQGAGRACAAKCYNGFVRCQYRCDNP